MHVEISFLLNNCLNQLAELLPFFCWVYLVHNPSHQSFLIVIYILLINGSVSLAYLCIHSEVVVIFLFLWTDS